jgi:hypothetical protein
MQQHERDLNHTFRALIRYIVIIWTHHYLFFAKSIA